MWVEVMGQSSALILCFHMLSLSIQFAFWNAWRNAHFKEYSNHSLKTKKKVVYMYINIYIKKKSWGQGHLSNSRFFFFFN